jgi:hypothetical protein
MLFNWFQSIGLNGLLDVVQLVEKGDSDLDYLMYYIESHGINTQLLPCWLSERIVKIIENGFEDTATAVFHLTPSCIVTKTIYTNKYSGNDLYVRDEGNWILVRDFVRLYDVVRGAAATCA